MKKPALQEVVCPHCQGSQSEPIGAISTNCKTCGRYFKTAARAEGRSSRAPKANREVVCLKCGAPNLISTAAISTQCIRCAHYIELGVRTVRGVQTAKFYAYDDVIFEENCTFKGMEATGRRMEVRGKIFSKLRATEEIVIMAGCQVAGELHAPIVRIERGAMVKVQEIECDQLVAGGAIEVTGMLAAGEIVMKDGADFSGRLQVPLSKLRIEAGVNAQLDTIVCAEFVVEGNVRLGTTVTTERLVVLSGGTLISPTVRAGRLEVSPGGNLQALIERYTAPEKPVEAKPIAKIKSEVRRSLDESGLGMD